MDWPDDNPIRLMHYIDLFAAAASGGTYEPPKEIMLVPAGHAKAVDGREFDNLMPDKIVKVFRKHKLDLPIDINHASEIKARRGEESPAVGWITDLTVRDGAVYGQVDWLDEGAALLKARTYRYLSPSVCYDYDHFERTGKLAVASLSSAALVNQPALNTLPALASQQQQPKEIDPMLDKILALFGLGKDATEEQALAVVAEAKALAALAPKQADQQQQQQPSIEFAALQSQFAKLQEVHTKLQAQMQVDAVNSAVDAAIADGKIAPASREYHVKAATLDLEGFKVYAASLPKLIADPKLADVGNTSVLTDVEREVCRLTGMAEKDFAAHKATIAQGVK
jgi:phage I-like protein